MGSVWPVNTLFHTWDRCLFILVESRLKISLEKKKSRQIQAKSSDFILTLLTPLSMDDSCGPRHITTHDFNVERTLELNWVSFSFFTAGSNSETTQLAWGWFNQGKVSFKAILLFSQMHRYLTSLLPELLTTVCYNCIRIETTWECAWPTQR